MLSQFFGHRGVEYFPDDGPSTFAHRYSQWQMGRRESLWPSPQGRPTSLNLRGSLARAASDASPAGRRSSSAPPSVVGEPPARATPSAEDGAQATGPTRHTPSMQDIDVPIGPVCPPTVTVQEVMHQVVSDWEVNVTEYEHLEWLIGTGLVIPYNVYSVCVCEQLG